MKKVLRTFFHPVRSIVWCHLYAGGIFGHFSSKGKLEFLPPSLHTTNEVFKQPMKPWNYGITRLRVSHQFENFFFIFYVKSLVYTDKTTTIDLLAVSTERSINKIRPQMLKKNYKSLGGSNDLRKA